MVNAVGPEGITVRRPGVGRGRPAPLHGGAEKERLMGMQGPTGHPPVHGLRPDVVSLDAAIRGVQRLHMGFVGRIDAVKAESDPARTPFPVCDGGHTGPLVIGQEEFPAGGRPLQVLSLQTERPMDALPPAFHESVHFLQPKAQVRIGLRPESMGVGRCRLRPEVVREGPTNGAVPSARPDPFAHHLQALGVLVGQGHGEPVAVPGEVTLRRHPDDARKQSLKDIGSAKVQRELAHLVIVPPNAHDAMSSLASRIRQPSVFDVEETSEVPERSLRHIAVPEPDKGQAGVPLNISPAFAMEAMDAAAPIPEAVTGAGLRSTPILGQHRQGAEPDTASHGLRREPDLPAAGHPLGAVIEGGIQQDPMVRSPTAAHLGDAIF